MGIYVTQQPSAFCLKRKREAAVGQALRRLARQGKCSYPYKGEQTLDALLYQCWGWALERPGDLDLLRRDENAAVKREPLAEGAGIVFCGEYYSDSWKDLFRALAPHVKRGSSVKWVLELGESGSPGGVTFDGWRARFYCADA